MNPPVDIQAHYTHYEAHGYCFPIPVLSTEEARSFRDDFEQMERVVGKRLGRADQTHLYFDWAYRLATHPRLVTVMKAFIGEDLLIHSTRIFSKNPGSVSFVSWHQDGRYSDLNNQTAPSIWIALSESTAENGCLRVIPDTHQSGVFAHNETYGDNNLLTHGESISDEIDPSKAVDVVLQPGQMSVHHVNTVHGSSANPSQTRRIGFAMTFITPDLAPPLFPAIHVAGQRATPGFDLLDTPPGTDMCASVAAHQQFKYRNWRFA